MIILSRCKNTQNVEINQYKILQKSKKGKFIVHYRVEAFQLESSKGFSYHLFLQVRQSR